uniref:Uncharacterized protein n=1 Tax=Lutzomyia longipalpis TaxID=7200 RepID=A0A1B0CB80_LUTLO
MNRKYLGLAFGTNCPVGITAAYTFPHIKGSNTFFWKKTTGTIQMIFVNDELEFLIKFLNTCDVEKTFNELIGANGAAMTTETVLFAESFKDILVNFLDQRNEKELFLNLNGIVVYHEIFQDMGIKLDPQTSPLRDLVYVKSPEEFLDIIEFRSAIVRSLHENLYTDWQHGDEAKNDYGYLKYAYGCSDLLYTLPDDIHTIFIEAGQPNHHTDKFNCVANVVEFMNGKSTALSQEGIRSLGINVQIAFGPVQLSISFNPSFGSSGQSTIGGSASYYPAVKKSRRSCSAISHAIT